MMLEHELAGVFTSGAVCTRKGQGFSAESYFFCAHKRMQTGLFAAFGLTCTADTATSQRMLCTDQLLHCMNTC